MIDLTSERTRVALAFLTHSDDDSYPTKVDCRAAGFTPDRGWNDSLDRRWKATRASGSART